MDSRKSLQLIMNSAGYRDARRRADSYLARIESGPKDEIGAVLRGKNLFFSSMRKKSPGLYALFEAEDRSLSRKAILRTTGTDIIID